MKQVFSLFFLLVITVTTFSQETSEAERRRKALEKTMLNNRANDHFMFQFGYDGWTNTGDSIRTTGFGRHANVYVMYDMPFGTAPKMSVAIGGGLGSSNIFFDDQVVRIAPTSSADRVQFIEGRDTTRFNKFKLTNIWLEAPVELRYITDPLNSSRSFKFAIGAKVGTMISAYTRGKNLQDKNDNSIYGEKYVLKEKQKAFFNGVRLAGTVRVGYGPLTLYGAYQINSLFKETNGPNIHPYSIGLCLSGL